MTSTHLFFFVTIVITAQVVAMTSSAGMKSIESSRL
eukprot:CAMPEP_0198114792 /NCGR_PEP_ID=MMETSP1442-20131203/6076_1 /TAXON_ID= /ORGANISM="Craspedostauros australis, Strain CCMP3328" /LENGTH=35 /DNA_ID= /DNA_START= /DNA_END= /DNA_ORIENTATION=